MLPRKTILISTVLTAFVLSMIGGVAIALKQTAVRTVSAATAVPATVPVSLSAQEAAAMAASILNQQDIYSVESAPFNGVDAYKVVFSSGQVAFVGLDGQILSITQIQPVVVTQDNVAPASGASDSGSAPVNSQSGGEHENGEHESGGHDD
jgi:hypothetical protein